MDEIVADKMLLLVRALQQKGKAREPQYLVHPGTDFARSLSDDVLDSELDSLIGGLGWKHPWRPQVFFVQDQQRIKTMQIARNDILAEFRHKVIQAARETQTELNEVNRALVEMVCAAYEQHNRMLNEEEGEIDRLRMGLLMQIAGQIHQAVEAFLSRSEDVKWHTSRLSIAPGIAGVYIVVDLDGLAYVGQSIDIRRRLSNSHDALASLDGLWLGFGIIETTRYLELESLLINGLMPRFNQRAR